MGADPCGEEKVPFCTKKRYEIDQVGEPDCIEFSHKKHFPSNPHVKSPITKPWMSLSYIQYTFLRYRSATPSEQYVE